MKNAAIFKTGVYLYALVFLVFGVNHFMNAGGMAGMVPGYMPGGGEVWIYITGAGMILAAISFLWGRYTMLSGLLLAALLLVFVFTIHLPGIMNAADENARTMPMTMLLKDTALAAGALMIAGKG